MEGAQHVLQATWCAPARCWLLDRTLHGIQSVLRVGGGCSCAGDTALRPGDGGQTSGSRTSGCNVSVHQAESTDAPGTREQGRREHGVWGEGHALQKVEPSLSSCKLSTRGNAFSALPNPLLVYLCTRCWKFSGCTTSPLKASARAKLSTETLASCGCQCDLWLNSKASSNSELQALGAQALRGLRWLCPEGAQVHAL